MIFGIFILSLAGVALALLSPDLSDVLIVAAPAALGSFLLLLSQLRKPRTKEIEPGRIIIDGSNVMYWRNGEPNLQPVREVIAELKKHGLKPGVVFDANAGHVLEGEFRSDKWFEDALDLPKHHAMLVPSGMPADPVILGAARDFGGRVVSNDRFRDWVSDYPEISKPGHVIRGGFRSGRLWLALQQGNTDTATATAAE